MLLFHVHQSCTYTEQKVLKGFLETTLRKKYKLHPHVVASLNLDVELPLNINVSHLLGILYLVAADYLLNG